MLAGLLTNQLVQAFNRVIFPALSEIQHDDERLRRAICYSMRTTVGVLTPVVCLVALIPEFTIGVILGEHWLPAVPALLVLLAMGWVRGIASVFGPPPMSQTGTGQVMAAPRAAPSCHPCLVLGRPSSTGFT